MVILKGLDTNPKLFKFTMRRVAKLLDPQRRLQSQRIMICPFDSTSELSQLDSSNASGPAFERMSDVLNCLETTVRDGLNNFAYEPFRIGAKTDNQPFHEGGVRRYSRQII